jgi:hypothetical protein
MWVFLFRGKLAATMVAKSPVTRGCLRAATVSNRLELLAYCLWGFAKDMFTKFIALRGAKCLIRLEIPRYHHLDALRDVAGHLRSLYSHCNVRAKIACARTIVSHDAINRSFID